MLQYSTVQEDRMQTLVVQSRTLGEKEKDWKDDSSRISQLKTWQILSYFLFELFRLFGIRYLSLAMVREDRLQVAGYIACVC